MNRLEDKFMTETEKAHGGNWSKWLGHLAGKPNVVGLEIGTFKGESAEWMLKNIFTHPTSRYYCCDFFKGSKEHRVAGIDCSTLESDTRTRLSPFLQAKIIKGYSHKVLREFVEPLDMAYVDGSHDSMNVLRDIILVFDLVKEGGVIIMDDYLWEVIPGENQRPKLAIDSFLSSYNNHYELLDKKWQVAIRKRSQCQNSEI